MLLELLSMRNTVDMPLLSQLKLVEMRPVAQKGWLKRQPQQNSSTISSGNSSKEKEVIGVFY